MTHALRFGVAKLATRPKALAISAFGAHYAHHSYLLFAAALRRAGGRGGLDEQGAFFSFLSLLLVPLSLTRPQSRRPVEQATTGSGRRNGGWGRWCTAGGVGGGRPPQAVCAPAQICALHLPVSPTFSHLLPTCTTLFPTPTTAHLHYYLHLPPTYRSLPRAWLAGQCGLAKSLPDIHVWMCWTKHPAHFYRAAVPLHASSLLLYMRLCCALGHTLPYPTPTPLSLPHIYPFALPAYLSFLLPSLVLLACRTPSSGMVCMDGQQVP